jgi:ACR3 family arsenite transporter
MMSEINAQKPEDQPPSSKEHTTDSPSPSTDPDIELQAADALPADSNAPKVSAFKSLGLLDRFLAVWIFLAMLVGILLGNFVPNTGPTLQRGQFVGVSIPIG